MSFEQKQKKHLSLEQGFTLIEAVTVLFIFAVVTTTFYAVFTTGTRAIIESKNRLGAVALANEKMEIIRNIVYDDVGTKHPDGSGGYDYGIPPGEILEDETITVNTRVYAVHTFVQYVDDSFDGKVSGTTPLDTVPTDYKRVRIEVTWGAGASHQSVALVATFVPKGVETSAGGGTLSINVIDNQGNGIGQMSAHISNSTTNPQIDLSTETDSTGNILLPGAPAATQSYVIALSKADYFGVTTLPPYPVSAFNPVDVHASVVAASLNQATLQTDESADLIIQTKDPFDENITDIDFHLIGGRRIGDTVATPSQPVYEFDQDGDSGAGAAVTLADRSSGNYTFTLLDTTRYELLRLSSDEVTLNVFTLQPGTTPSIVAILMDKNLNSVLFRVTDQASAQPITSASVHLTNTLLSYDVTLSTDRYGQAYFPAALPTLTAGSYEYEVSATGFNNASGSVVVDTGLAEENIPLTAF